MADVFIGFEGLDSTAPQVQNQVPVPSATGVLVTSNVFLEIVDDPGGSGVDLASVDIDLDGVPAVVAGVAQAGYPTSIIAITDGYSFDINPDVNLTFNDTIPVQVDAQDLALIPNVMTTVNYDFDTEIGDTSGPILENQTPAPDAIDVARDTTIVMDIVDPPTTPTFGVDLATINIQVNGDDAVVGGVVQSGWSGNITVQGSGFRVALLRDTDFVLFENVLVEVQAADLIAGNPLDTSYTFKIDEGLTDAPPVLNAFAGDNQVRLSWTIDENVLIGTWQLVRSEVALPVLPTEGVILLEGTDQLFIDLDVVNGKRYFYSIFLIRRFEAGQPLYAPYSEVSSKSARPRAIAPSLATRAEYRPQRGEFGRTADPVPGARLTGIFGDRVSGGTRTSDGLTVMAGSVIRSPSNGNVSKVGSSGQAQFIEIETSKFIFVLDNIQVDTRIMVGAAVDANELIGRSTGGEISFSIFRKPAGTTGLRVVRPSLFVARVEDREGRK